MQFSSLGYFSPTRRISRSSTFLTTFFGAGTTPSIITLLFIKHAIATTLSSTNTCSSRASAMISIYIPCHVPLRLWKAPVVRAPRGLMRFVALAKQNFKGRFLSFITTGLRVRTTSVPNVRQTQCLTLTANCRMRNVWRK